MKNNLSIGLLSRWVIAPLLVGFLIAWSVSPAHSGDAPPASAKNASPQQASNTSPANNAADTNADVQELKVRMKELEALELDGQRKTIDWWFSFLAVLTAFMAFFGALIPFLMARKDKEIIEQDKAQIKLLLTEVKNLKEDAVSDVQKIRQHAADAAKLTKELQTYRSDPTSTTQDNDHIKQTIANVQKTTAPEDVALGLRAEAIAADQAEDAARAYKLWNALTVLAKDDSNAQFNAGYRAQELGDKELGAEKLYWLRTAGAHYSQALSLEPSMHWAANNWGVALSEEAKALSTTKPDAARALWQQAIDKFQLALTLKPDKYEAFSNWGEVLNAEACAIKATDPVGSKQLRDKAEQLLLAHAEAAPGVMAYNLACVYGASGNVASCIKWLKISHKHNALPDCTHLCKDTDLDTVRNSSEFIEWISSVCDSTGSPRTA